MFSSSDRRCPDFILASREGEIPHSEARYGMVSPDDFIEVVSKSEKVDIAGTFLYKIIQNKKQYYITVSIINSL